MSEIDITQHSVLNNLHEESDDSLKSKSVRSGSSPMIFLDVVCIMISTHSAVMPCFILIDMFVPYELSWCLPMSVLAIRMFVIFLV